MAELFSTGPPPNDKHREWVRRVQDCLLARGLLAAKESMAEGVRLIATLRKRASDTDLELVLAWFERHAGEQFVPAVGTVRDFCGRFERLRSACDRDLEYARELLDKRTKAFLAAQEALAWPPEIAAHLGELIARSQKRWHDFYLRMESAACGTRRVREVAFLVMVMHRRSPVILTNWFKALNERHGGREHYRGPVAALAFDPKSDLFRDTFWRAWSQEWSGSPRTFDGLLEELNRAE